MRGVTGLGRNEGKWLETRKRSPNNVPVRLVDLTTDTWPGGTRHDTLVHALQSPPPPRPWSPGGTCSCTQPEDQDLPRSAWRPTRRPSSGQGQWLCCSPGRQPKTHIVGSTEYRPSTPYYFIILNPAVGYRWNRSYRFLCLESRTIGCSLC